MVFRKLAPARTALSQFIPKLEKPHGNEKEIVY